MKEQNLFLPYEPFQWTEPKVSREEDGLIEAGEFRQVIEGVLEIFDSDHPKPEDIEIDMALAECAKIALEALAMRAGKGQQSAAGFLHNTIMKGLADYTILVDRENEQICEMLKHSKSMPGVVSLIKPLMDHELERAKKAGVGRKYSFPKTSKSQRSRGPNPRTAQHLVAGQIYNYVMENKKLPEIFPDLLNPEHGKIHPIRERMIRIPALTTETVDEWMGLAKEILNDATDGQFQEFYIFNQEPYKGMNQTGKFWDRLRDGFEAKAIGLQDSTIN